MRTSSILLWALVIAIVVIGGAYYFWGAGATPVGETNTATSGQNGTDYTPGATNTDMPGSLDGAANLPTSASVSYDGASFSPSTVTIAEGGTVTFTSTVGTMWVATAPHPAHTAYDGTDRATHCAVGYTGPKPFDQCANGASFAFTFTQAGTFAYHNHSNPGAFGTIIVR